MSPLRYTWWDVLAIFGLILSIAGLYVAGVSWLALLWLIPAAGAGVVIGWQANDRYAELTRPPAETFCGTCGHLDTPGVHPFPECPRHREDEKP